jgi:tetratricopeptide (TPR) repeat protein
MKRAGCAALALAILAATPAASQRGLGPPAKRYELRGEAGLTRVYDSILEARFDQVPAELKRACGPAPPEACQVLAATALWWRIQLDPDNTILDEEFSAAVERAIASAEEWTVRAPDDAEAWFYLGAAYASRVQWRVLRREKLSAARDGKRIKEALERAVALAPTLYDAYFGIGMYRYYADVAPAALRFVRFLLLLPGGNRKEGLEQMLRTREHGRLLQGEADYQLHIIYLWYEKQADKALELLAGLQKQYPENPLFLVQIAEIQDTYLHDITASLDTWRALLGMAREQRVNAAAIAEVRARLGVARQLDALQLTDHAIEQLTAIVKLEPQVPYSALALAHLRLGEAYDRLGRRDDAVASYRRVAQSVPDDDRYELADEADEKIRTAPDRTKAEAYRLSLEGWRWLEQKDLPGAAAALDRSLALQPRDPVAHYRRGRLLQAQRDDEGALGEFERAIREGRHCPAPILAAAHLEAARLHERAGHRDQALSAYRIAATLFGAAAETRAAATRAISRLEK